MEDFVYLMAYLAECKVYDRDVHPDIGSEDGEPIAITDEVRELLELQKQKMLDVFVHLINFKGQIENE